MTVCPNLENQMLLYFVEFPTRRFRICAHSQRPTMTVISFDKNLITQVTYLFMFPLVIKPSTINSFIIPIHKLH